MNFPEVSFPALLDELALLSGLDATAGEVNHFTARRMALALTQATEYCWKLWPWEEVCLVATGLTSEDSSLRFSSLLQPGYTVLGVYAEDPVAAWAANEIPKRLDRRTGNDGATEVVEVTTPAYYWLRLASPVFNSVLHNTDTVYAPGDGCYTAPGGVTTPGDSWLALRGNNDSAPEGFEDWGESPNIVSGDIYRAAGVLRIAIDSAATATAAMKPISGADWEEYFNPSPRDWAPQRLPLFLKTAVLEGAAALLLRHQDGQMSAARYAESRMDALLEDEIFNRRLRSSSQD